MRPKRRTRYSPEARRQLLADFARGGESSTTFVAARGVRLATLRTWLSRYGRSRRPTRPASAVQPVRFVAVEPAASSAASLGAREALVEVVVGGLEIRIPVAAGASFVADVARALGRERC